MGSQVLIGGAALAMRAAGVALAQHAPPAGAAAPRAQEPYGIETFGVFRDLMLQGTSARKSR